MEATRRTLFQDLIMTGKDFVNSEVDLFREELKTEVRQATKHFALASFFGAMLALSILPFLAFVIIAVGDALGGRYDLAALWTAIVCVVIAGPLAFYAFRKLTKTDMRVPLTRETVQRTTEHIKEKAKEVTH